MQVEGPRKVAAGPNNELISFRVPDQENTHGNRRIFILLFKFRLCFQDKPPFVNSPVHDGSPSWTTHLLIFQEVGRIHDFDTLVNSNIQQSLIARDNEFSASR